MLILPGTFVLPQLAPSRSRRWGWKSLDYQFTWPAGTCKPSGRRPPVRTASVFLHTDHPLRCDRPVMGQNTGLLCSPVWGIYIFFYTSVFTTGRLFTGHSRFAGLLDCTTGRACGGQPWYYYLLIQIPIYDSCCIRAWTGADFRTPPEIPRPLSP